MPSEHTWWLDCLESATLPGNKEFSDESENVVERASCFDALRTGGDMRNGLSHAILGFALRHLVMGDRGAVPATKRQGARHYRFPPLGECRRAFAAYYETDESIIFNQ